MLVEFEAFQEQLADMEPSVQSLLSYIRNVVTLGPPWVAGRARYEMQDPTDEAKHLNTSPATWEPVPGIPNDLDRPTAWGIGMEAVIPYKAQAADRKVWTGGAVA